MGAVYVAELLRHMGMEAKVGSAQLNVGHRQRREEKSELQRHG